MPIFRRIIGRGGLGVGGWGVISSPIFKHLPSFHSVSSSAVKQLPTRRQTDAKRLEMEWQWNTLPRTTHHPSPTSWTSGVGSHQQEANKELAPLSYPLLSISNQYILSPVFGVARSVGARFSSMELHWKGIDIVFVYRKVSSSASVRRSCSLLCLGKVCGVCTATACPHPL